MPRAKGCAVTAIQIMESQPDITVELNFWRWRQCLSWKKILKNRKFIIDTGIYQH